MDLTNQFLIAMPGMGDDTFAGAVIYLCEHNDKGALGLVINKTIELDLNGLFYDKSYATSLAGTTTLPPVPPALPTYHNEQGKPAMMDSVIAVYEEFPGPITRHGEFSQDARQLVVKYFTQIGNYDYGFKWSLTAL